LSSGFLSLFTRTLRNSLSRDFFFFRVFFLRSERKSWLLSSTLEGNGLFSHHPVHCRPKRRSFSGVRSLPQREGYPLPPPPSRSRNPGEYPTAIPRLMGRRRLVGPVSRSAFHSKSTSWAFLFERSSPFPAGPRAPSGLVCSFPYLFNGFFFSSVTELPSFVPSSKEQGRFRLLPPSAQA